MVDRWRSRTVKRGRLEALKADMGLILAAVGVMRLRNIDSIEAAHAFVPSFMVSWNDRFAVAPSDPVPAHRPWTQSEDALERTGFVKGADELWRHEIEALKAWCTTSPMTGCG